MSINTRPAASTGQEVPRRSEPPLPVPAVALAALTVATVATSAGVRPDTDPASVLRGVQSSSTATLAAMLLTASAVPLLMWAAALRQRFTTLGIRVVAPTISLVCGILAAVALALSGLAAWVEAAVAPLGDVALVTALNQLSFAAGGPLFATGFGLAILGATVPCLLRRLVPRPLAVAGVVLGVLGAVSPLVLLWLALGPVLPVVRFGGLLWVLVFSAVLPLTPPPTGASGTAGAR